MKPYYEHAGITIYHGDCLELAAEMPLADLILTDPPFFMPAQHYASRADWQKSWGDTAILARWWDGVVSAFVPRMNPTARVLTFCDDESYPVFFPPLYRRFDNLQALVWAKESIGMGSEWRHSHEFILSARWKGSRWVGGASSTDVIRARVVPSSARLHPVDKPTGLLRQLIEPTTNEGDLVIDPFMGGGSTLVAALESKRRAVGIEIEERYCEIAAKRLSQEVFDFKETA